MTLCKCDECPLKDAPGPVFGTGPTSAKFAIVAEAPGRQEADKGEPMVGPSGKLSDQILRKAETKRSEVFITNVVACRPTDQNDKDKAPDPKAIECCSARLKAELDALDTDIVVATGATAVTTLYDQKVRLSDVIGASKWVNDRLVLGTWHPAYVLRGNLKASDDILDVYSRAKGIASHEIAYPPRHRQIDYTYATTSRQVGEALTKLEALAQNPVVFALDTETEYAGDPTFTLLMTQISTDDETWVLEQAPLSRMKNRFARLLTNDNITWVLHNLSFDFQYLLHNFGVVPKHAHDTMAMALSLAEVITQDREGSAFRNDIGLKKLSRKHLGADNYEAELHKYQISAENPMSLIPREVLVPYAAYDARYTSWLYPIMRKLVEEAGTWSLYEDILLPTQKTFVDMEYHGVLINKTGLESIREMLLPRIDNLTAQARDLAATHGFKMSDCVEVKPEADIVEGTECQHQVKVKKGLYRNCKGKGTTNGFCVRHGGIHKDIDESFNPSSVIQRRYLLYNLMKFEKIYEDWAAERDQKPSTGTPFFKAYPNAPITKVLQEHARYRKVVGTYVEGFLDDIGPDDRVRPSFRLFGATTGRISATNPPIQVITRNDSLFEGIPSLREMFIAPPGYKLIEADYAALEMYIAAHYSQDENLIEVLNEVDSHSATASRIFGVSIDEVSKVQRQIAKTLNYAAMYKSGVDKIVSVINQQLPEITYNECADYLRAWNRSYPKVIEWADAQQRQVAKRGELTTSTGRKRRWQFMLDDPKVLAEAKRQAVNFPIQSLANDLCLMSMIELNRRIKQTDWGHVIITVHDSIELEVKEEHVDDACRMIYEVMPYAQFESPIDYFPIEIKVGDNWSDMKLWEESK